MKKTKLLLLFTFVFLSFKSWGYPNFIGHSYTSCLNCHYNPFGNGPLNDYGRAVSATLTSARWPYPKTWTEEDLANKSGFLFRKPKQDWFRTQINYRRFKLTKNPGSSNNEMNLWITMQADARAIIKFGQNDRFIGVVNYGYAPAPLAKVSTVPDEDAWRSREHYIGYKFTPKFGVYAGLMDKVYGIRVIEHIAYSRTMTQLTMNDQSHGVMMHFLDKAWEVGLHGFVGNLDQDEELRLKGASTMIERTVGDGDRIGASFMSNANTFYSQQNAAIHGRFNLKEGSAILTELGQTQKTITSTKNKIDSRYGLIQTYIRPTRGVYVLNNIEYSKANVLDEDFIGRWGLGLQVFPMQRVELRADIYNSRTFGPKTSTPDSWILLLQTHLWL